MIKTIVNFKGLYGDKQAIYLPDFIHHEPLETRSKMYDWEIKEHLHTELFQVFIITKGEGMIISENKELKIIGPCIITIPTNALHGFIFQPDITGEVITFSESFLENIFKPTPKILHGINRFNLLLFQKNTGVFHQIGQYINEIVRELYDDNLEKQTVIQSLFQLFFIGIYRYSILQRQTIAQSDNRTLQYFQAFQKSIKQSLHETKSISQYSQELHITSVHLNRICKSVVQKSALEIVHEYLINEAKKYLLNTNYSVSEISYFLSFKDPAYFTRLFKKQTGVTPTDFRKN
ncbi:helix-turn-helix domain-containing protein [Emticicia sp. BO119]|uniref:helix-turn-helix domain-containing protein n=1 Tax=Emticicia sp. BO119 TaxID=2757768 RepID=UPI0015F00CC9|nr:helix-turn-helix domain-containing protein [Emticicia sp. BO119]MBA4850264.1 helix-turn-helix domain-containing protein [Emticicia sp. BO119]